MRREIRTISLIEDFIDDARRRTRVLVNALSRSVLDNPDDFPKELVEAVSEFVEDFGSETWTTPNVFSDQIGLMSAHAALEFSAAYLSGLANDLAEYEDYAWQEIEDFEDFVGVMDGRRDRVLSAMVASLRDWLVVERVDDRGIKEILTEIKDAARKIDRASVSAFRKSPSVDDYLRVFRIIAKGGGDVYAVFERVVRGDDEDRDQVFADALGWLFARA